MPALSVYLIVLHAVLVGMHYVDLPLVSCRE